MNTGKFVFSQIVEFLSKKKFDRLVSKYQGNYKVKKFTCWEQFLCMLYAQLAGKESLRDVSVCLMSLGKSLYHFGIRSNVSRSTLSEANESRDFRIYQDFASLLIEEASKLYAETEFEIDFKEAIYALDSTTIDLCLTLFPWASFRKTKAGIKLHTEFDIKSGIPTFVVISAAKVSDVHLLDWVNFKAGAIYVVDRGYFDTKRLKAIDNAGAFFVIRKKKNTIIRNIKMISRTEIITDRLVKFTLSKHKYPDVLRQVRYKDLETGKVLIFLTNNLTLPAQAIADIYKQRWQIELFFKWIKQHLMIHSFLGTSANAVKTQIWVAICAFVLVAIIRKKLKIENFSMHTILQIFEASLFTRIHVLSVFANLSDQKIMDVQDNQLILL
jgi:hypothetical protein